MESGCRAAAAGGITSLACMPNTTPAYDSPETIAYIVEKARSASAVSYTHLDVYKRQDHQRCSPLPDRPQGGEVGEGQGGGEKSRGKG